MILHMFGSRFDVSGSTDHRESKFLSATKDILYFVEDKMLLSRLSVDPETSNLEPIICKTICPGTTAVQQMNESSEVKEFIC